MQPKSLYWFAEQHQTSTSRIKTEQHQTSTSRIKKFTLFEYILVHNFMNSALQSKRETKWPKTCNN